MSHHPSIVFPHNPGASLYTYVSKLSSAPPQLVCVTLRLRLMALAPEHEESTMLVMLEGQAEASSSTVSVILPLFDNSAGVSQSVEPLTSYFIRESKIGANAVNRLSSLPRNLQLCYKPCHLACFHKQISHHHRVLNWYHSIRQAHHYFPD